LLAIRRRTIHNGNKNIAALVDVIIRESFEA
jgi:hypothetical protein